MSERIEELIPELKASIIEWTPDVRTAVVMLMATDRNFFIENSRQLKPEYFPDEVSRAVLRFLIKYFDNHKKLPSRQIVMNDMQRRWRGSGEWPEVNYQLCRIYEYVESLSLEHEHLQELVTEFCKEEAMKCALSRCFDLVMTPERGHTRFDEMDRIFREAISVGADVEAGDFYFQSHKTRYDILFDEMERHGDMLDKFGTGFKGIDIPLEGGLNRKEIALYAGLSGSGKSFMLIWHAAHLVAAGYKVLFITLENSKRVTSRRFDSCFSGVDSGKLLANYRDKVSTALDKWAKRHGGHGDLLHIAEFPQSKTPIEELEAYEHQLQVRHGWKADAVVMDYLDELKMPSKMELYDAQAEVLGRFKGWMQETARDKGMFGLTATQINRQGTSIPVITEAQFATSFNKIFKVDACWSINRNDADREMDTVRLFVVKHRNAKSRYLVYLQVDFATCQFKEISEKEYSERARKVKGDSDRKVR